MKFKVIAKSYLFGELINPDTPAAASYDYPDEHLPRDAEGNIRFEKLPNLEPLEKPAPVKPKVAQVSQQPDSEDGAGDDDGKPVLTEAQKAESIKLAIAGLDPANNAHWTKAGEPNLMAVQEITGFPVSRKEAEAVEPGFRRPTE